MALTPQQIFDKYNVLFADNNTGEISELDLRNFVKDLTDALGAAEVSSIIPTWAAGLTFQTDGTGDGEFCRHADSSGNIRLFQTKTDNNTGNEPPTDPNTTENTHWIEISASSSSAFVEWSAGVYGAGLIIVYYSGNLYILTQGVRPFNSTQPPDVDTGNWQQITNVGGSGGPAIAERYPTWALLLADQAAQESGKVYYATDASGFSTVDSGYAYFEYLGTTNGNESDYRKLTEGESMDLDLSGKADKPTALGAFDPVGIVISSSGRYSNYTLTGNFAPSFGSGHVDFQTQKVRMSINGQAVTMPSGVILVTNALNNLGADFSNGDVPEIGDYEFIFDYDGVNITVVMYKAPIIGALPQLTTPTLVAESQDGQILLTLSEIDSEADTYVFEERLSPSGSWSVIHTGTTNPFTSTGLVNGTAYDHRAKVQGAGHSDSEYSTIQTTTPSTEPLTINSFTKSLTNKYVDIVLGTGIYGANDGTTPLSASDLKITNLVQGGVTAVTISAVTKNDNFIQGSASALTGGESAIRVWLSYTGTPNSTESFQIQPFDGASIYNAAGTAMALTETTGTIKLNINLYELWDAAEDSSVQITELGISTMFGINGNVNLTQTTNADRPTHSPGLNEVIFDRSNSEYLIGGDVATLEKQQSDNFSIIIKRLSTNSPGNTQYVFAYKGANLPSNDPRGVSISVGGDGSLFFSMHDGTAQNITDLDGFDNSGEETFIFVNNGGVMSVYDSTNTLVGTQGSTSIGAISYTSLRLLLGARESQTMPNGTTVMNGYWEKIAFINQALTSDQRQDILDNL